MSSEFPFLAPEFGHSQEEQKMYTSGLEDQQEQIKVDTGMDDESIAQLYHAAFNTPQMKKLRDQIKKQFEQERKEVMKMNLSQEEKEKGLQSLRMALTDSYIREGSKLLDY